MASDEERRRLASTFDAAADRYQRARPSYPDELIDTLVEATGVDKDSRILEIGCASGKATIQLAERGLSVTALEPGDSLVAAARANLARFATVDVEHATFESWSPPPDRFDLVVAATAWRWVDPKVRYSKAAEALVPGGHLAFFDALHVFPPGGDDFFVEIQDVYDEIGEGQPPGGGQPQPGELAEHVDEIEATGLFAVALIRHFDWEITYTAEEYIDLLETFSGQHRDGAGPPSPPLL